MNKIIYLGEWEAKSLGDNPDAFENLSVLYDFYEVPKEHRLDDINYLNVITWKPEGDKYCKEIIVRKLEVNI